MRQAITGGIRVRLLMLVIGVALPLAYVGWAGLQAMWESSRHELDDSVKQQAELAAVAFKQWIDAQQEPLATLAAYSAAEPVRIDDFHKTLRLLVGTRAHWVGLRVLNAEGETVLKEPDAAPPLPVTMRADLREQMQRGSWTLDTDWSQGPTHELLVIATPIETGGAVIAQIDIATISNFFFHRIELPEQAVLAVFGPQHRLLLYRNDESVTPLGTDLSDSPFFAALSDRPAVSLEMKSPLDGKRRVYGLARVGETGCVVMIGFPSDQLYSPAKQQFKRHLLFSLAALLAAMVAALVIARGIAYPLRLLSDAAQQFGSGHFAAQPSVKAGGEIGDLSAAFSGMAAQIREREARLRELDRLKSDFVSGVSHEMRTPLTTIKTLTHVLLRSELTTAERREYLETIAAECERQIDLILNLLDLSRIEAGTFNLTLARVNVIEIIHACIAVERHNAEARQQELSADLPTVLPDVLADRAALRRILCNLVENAIKYTADGGRIRLSAASESGEVAIRVIDNGRGILSKDLPRIFDKFYRGHPPAPTGSAFGAAVESIEAPGVGLGLYLAQTIITEIGGRIEVESKISEGTTFTLYLPVVEAQEPAGVGGEKRWG